MHFVLIIYHQVFPNLNVCISIMTSKFSSEPPHHWSYTNLSLDLTAINSWLRRLLDNLLQNEKSVDDLFCFEACLEQPKTWELPNFYQHANQPLTSDWVEKKRKKRKKNTQRIKKIFLYEFHDNGKHGTWIEHWIYVISVLTIWWFPQRYLMHEKNVILMMQSENPGTLRKKQQSFLERHLPVVCNIGATDPFFAWSQNCWIDICIHHNMSWIITWRDTVLSIISVDCIARLWVWIFLMDFALVWVRLMQVMHHCLMWGYVSIWYCLRWLILLCSPLHLGLDSLWKIDTSKK